MKPYEFKLYSMIPDMMSISQKKSSFIEDSIMHNEGASKCCYGACQTPNGTFELLLKIIESWIGNGSIKENAL